LKAAGEALRQVVEVFRVQHERKSSQVVVCATL
jgi:hypothetical protein